MRFTWSGGNGSELSCRTGSCAGGPNVFVVAGKALDAKLYPIDTPLANIPSGKEGLEPQPYPARRGAAAPIAAVESTTTTAAPSTVSVEARAADASTTTDASTTSSTTKSAAARFSSIVVSFGAIVFAGLFL